MAAAAAAWRQRGVSGSSTINNQLKASAAMGMDMAMMIATATTIEAKVTAAVAAAWRQHGRQHGGITAAAAALLQRGSGSAVVQQWRPKDVVGLPVGNSKNIIF